MAVALETLHQPQSTVPVDLTESLTPLNSTLETSRTFPLIITNNSLDIEVPLTDLDPQNRFGRAYEKVCLKAVADVLAPDEVAYGAHILERAFGKVIPPFTSIPDVLVARLISPYPNAGIGLGPAIELTRIIEARTGKINGNFKLAGFRNLVDDIATNPYKYQRSIAEILNGRGGLLNPDFIIAPPIQHLDVTFYTPRLQDERGEESRQNHLDDRPFRRVSYETIPLPELPIPASTS